MVPTSFEVSSLLAAARNWNAWNVFLQITVGLIAHHLSVILKGKKIPNISARNGRRRSCVLQGQYQFQLRWSCDRWVEILLHKLYISAHVRTLQIEIWCWDHNGVSTGHMQGWPQWHVYRCPCCNTIALWLQNWDSTIRKETKGHNGLALLKKSR